jgi:hypothetical protein
MQVLKLAWIKILGYLDVLGSVLSKNHVDAVV